jgi:hypothetical protein
MSHIHEDIWIEAPIEVVYGLFCDPSRNPRLSVEDVAVSNISGPMDQVGTTFDSTVRLPGIELTQRSLVTEVEPFRLIRVVDAEGDDVIYRFEPEGAGTRFSIDVEHAPAGAFGKIPLRVVVDGAIDRGLRRMDDRLKAMAEAEVPEPV